MKSMKYALAGLLGLAGCVALAASASATTIGFSQVGHESDWRTAFSKSMQETAKAEGIDFKFSDANQKEEDQLKAVRSFIAQKVDAIIIAPVVVTGWDQVLKEAKAANIPVFLVDRDIETADKSLYVTRVAADFNLEGRLAGAWLAQALKGRGDIVELQGTVGSAPAIERKKGFELRPGAVPADQDRQVAERRLHDPGRQGSDGEFHQGDRRPEGDQRGLGA